MTQPGDPLRIPAAKWDALCELLDRYIAGEFDREALDLFNTPPDRDCIWMRNDHGSILRCGHAVGFSEPSQEDVQEDEQKKAGFKNNPRLIAGTPTQEDIDCCRWGVVQNITNENCLVKINISGWSVVEVEIKDTSHKYVKPTAGETEILETCETNKGAQLLIDISSFEEGDIVCVPIRLSNCGGGEGQRICPDCGFPANSTHKGTVVSSTNGEVTILSQDPDGNPMQYTVEILGGGVPSGEVIWHVTDNCEKVIYCKPTCCECEKGQLFLCPQNIYGIETVSSVYDEGDETIVHTIRATCLQSGSSSEFSLSPLSCENDQCASSEIQVSGCPSLLLNYGNNLNCCCMPFFCHQQLRLEYGFDVTAEIKSIEPSESGIFANMIACFTRTDNGQVFDFEGQISCVGCGEIVIGTIGQFQRDVVLHYGPQASKDECECCAKCYDCPEGSDYTVTVTGLSTFGTAFDFSFVNGMELTVPHGLTLQEVPPNNGIYCEFRIITAPNNLEDIAFNEQENGLTVYVRDLLFRKTPTGSVFGALEMGFVSSGPDNIFVYRFESNGPAPTDECGVCLLPITLFPDQNSIDNGNISPNATFVIDCK